MTEKAIEPKTSTDLIQDTTPCVDWQEALATFLNTLSSPRTAKAYQRAVVEAMETLSVDYVADLTPPDLATYRSGLVARLDADREDRLSPATVKLKLAGLRQFINFCRVTGITRLSKDVIEFLLKSPKAEVQKPYEVLSKGERRRLLRVARERGPREHALVSLCLGAGLRVSELVNVRLDDFSQGEGGWWVLVRMGKGRKDRLVPIAPSVMNSVKEWVDNSERDLARKADRETWLFTTRQSPRMTAERAWQLVKELVEEAGIEKPISPHSLRHTMAIETLRAGASPVVVQKVLGHSSLETTQKYLDHLERADLSRWAFSPV
jgi:site-specific recombinase XerD